MKFILMLVGIILLVCAFAVPSAVNHARKTDAYKMASMEDRRNGTVRYEKFPKSFGIICCVLAIVLSLLSSSFVVIPTGYTGVRATFGQIDEHTVQNGFNWKLPFVQSIEVVNNKQQDVVFKDKIWSETAERTAIFYEGITVTYQINPSMSAWIYANVSDYKASLVSQNLVASAVKASSKGLSDTDATNRSIIEPLAIRNIQESLDEKYGAQVVFVTKVTINNADFEDSYNAAIAARQQAMLAAEQQAIENQRAVDKATADAAVTRTNAEAKADAQLLQAQATAEANKLLEKSLTENILMEMLIQKWDGQLPVYLTDGNQMFTFPIGE